MKVMLRQTKNHSGTPGDRGSRAVASDVGVRMVNCLAALLAAAWMGFGAANTLAFGGSYPGKGEEIQGKAGEGLPSGLVDVGIDEHLGSPIPLDAKFKDEEGHDVTLSSYFQAGKPVLMNFAYYKCPMLCNLVLSGMVDGMKKMTWTPGKEYEVVTIGIDPKEGPDLAKAKKATHIEALAKSGSAVGWHFLTGEEEQIKRVADAVGFHFNYNKTTG